MSDTAIPEFQFSNIVCIRSKTPHSIAMVKWPTEAADPIGGIPGLIENPETGVGCIITLKNRVDEEVDVRYEHDDPFRVSRYELHFAPVQFDQLAKDLGVDMNGLPFMREPEQEGEVKPEFKPKTPDEIIAIIDGYDSIKDGYVYLPKLLRDGRHDELYTLNLITKENFDYNVGRGMFEEVVWSSLGNPEDAWEMEQKNLKRNDMLREWA